MLLDYGVCPFQITIFPVNKVSPVKITMYSVSGIDPIIKILLQSAGWFHIVMRSANKMSICHIYFSTGPRSAVGNVSGYRCVSDCNSRGREFDPSPILSVKLIMELFLRSFSSLPLIHSRRVVVSYKRKYVHELLVIRLFKPAQEKVWLGELTVPQ